MSVHISSDTPLLRHDWQREELLALFDLPFPDLLHRAATAHRAHFDPAEVQVSTLLSVKTGGCPEDCAYCPQAQRYDTGVEAQKLMDAEQVLAKAAQAKAAGASRFCMGAAWRSPKDRDIPKVAEMIRGVKAMGLETCATLGMLSGAQAQAFTIMKFTILRDGTVRDVELEKRSGIYELDARAQRAMAQTPRLPPLPEQFTNPTLTVHLTFEYTR